MSKYFPTCVLVCIIFVVKVNCNIVSDQTEKLDNIVAESETDPSLLFNYIQDGSGARMFGLSALVLLGFGIVLVALLFLPAPVVSTGKQFDEISRGILRNNECIERVACELSRIARGNDFVPDWLERLVKKSPSKFGITERISKAATSFHCSQYSCKPVNSVKRAFLDMMTMGGGKAKRPIKMFPKHKSDVQK